MRAGIVGIFFFAAVLVLGHYVAAPFFCRGGIAIPTLDPRALCGADFHLNQSGSVLLYFGAIALAMIFGVLAGVQPNRRKKAAEEQSKASHAETFEQIVVATEAKEAAALAEKKEPSTPPVAHPSALALQTAASTETPAPAAPAPKAEAAPAAPATPPADAKPADAKPADTKPADTKPAEPTLVEAKPEDAPKQTAAAPAPGPAPGPSTAEAAVAAAILSGFTAPPAAKVDLDILAAAMAEKKPEPNKPEPEAVAVTKSAPRGPFDGTNLELVERFRELKKDENVNSIAQAQRLLDESTLSALGRGVDPKQHLSDIAHLVLAEDPDLKSGVVRGVVVHIAARLKELGVVQQIPNPAKPAA